MFIGVKNDQVRLKQPCVPIRKPLCFCMLACLCQQFHLITDLRDVWKSCVLESVLNDLPFVWGSWWRAWWTDLMRGCTTNSDNHTNVLPCDYSNVVMRQQFHVSRKPCDVVVPGIGEVACEWHGHAHLHTKTYTCNHLHGRIVTATRARCFEPVWICSFIGVCVCVSLFTCGRGLHSSNITTLFSCTTSDTSCTVQTESSVKFKFCISVTAQGQSQDARATSRCQSGMIEGEASCTFIYCCSATSVSPVSPRTPAVKLPPVTVESVKPVRGRPRCLEVTWKRSVAFFPLSDYEVTTGELKSQIEFTSQGQVSHSQTCLNTNPNTRRQVTDWLWLRSNKVLPWLQNKNV